jgi:peptide/nickel transport system permease protein
MKDSHWFYVGMMILALMLTAALFAPLLAPHDPAQQNLEQDLLTYSRSHPLGTDKLGRDILSRTIYGSRVSLSVGVATVTLSLAIGLAIGSL